MNTNYFSSNKSYPEPKIIEYDLEETSTDSSPQHTSSLYSESTDQDSESIHPNNAYSKPTFHKPTECHVTKELKTMSPNQDYPVPSQFADLNLNRRNSIDDHQHSNLHSAYNQVDDDNIIEDIPLSDNTNRNKIDSNLKNQENPELQTNKQIHDYYANTNKFSPNNYFSENENGLKSNINSVSYNVASSSDRTHYSQVYNGSYFNPPNTLFQPSSLISSSVQPQSKPLYSYNNTEMSSYQQKSSNIQNYNDCIQPGMENQHNKPVFQNTPPINIKLQSDTSNSNNTMVKSILNQSTSEAHKLNDQNNFQFINSGTSKLNKQQNLPTTDSINQQLVYSSSKSSVSEFSNDTSSVINQQFTSFNPSLVSSTQSVGPITSAAISTLKSSTAAEIKENHNESHQPSDDQARHLFNLSNTSKNSPSNSVKQDSINTLNSEFNITPSQSPSVNLAKNQQEIMASPTSSIYKQSNESQNDYIKSLSPISIPNFTQPNNVISSNSITSQIETNYNQLSPNQLTSQKSTYGSIHTSSNQFSNHFTHSINNQNVTAASVVGQSVGNYFDSVNTSNQSIFHHQSPNTQCHGLQQNISAVTPPIISSFPLTDESKNSTIFSNIQDTPVNSLSSIQQSMSIKKELDITESVKLDSDIASEETVKLNTTDSVEYATAIQSNNLTVDSLQNTEIKNFSSQVSDILPPNDQFSNMTIDNQQNLPVSQPFGQEQIISTSFFSKGTSLNEESHSNAYQNLSSTLHDTSYSTFELSGDKDLPQFLKNKQTESLFINPDQPTAHSFSTLPMNNESILNEQSIQSGTDRCPPLQLSSNKVTSNSILPQIFSNEPKPGAFSTPSSVTNQLTTQLPSNQPISNTVPHNLSHVNRSSPQLFSAQSNIDSVSSTQSTSNLFAKQSFNNQPALATGPSASLSTNQLPTQMFNNQPMSDNAQPLQSTSNPYSTNQFNNQAMPFEITPNTSSVVNQFPHKMFDSQSKINAVPLLSSVVNQHPSKTSNNQSTPTNTWPPVSSTTINQFPLPQPPTSGCPLVQSFNNQTTQNTIQLVSSVANQLPSRMFGNPPKSGTPPLKSMENQYSTQSSINQSMLNTVSPILSTANHVPEQMFSNQFKSDLFSPQTTFNQYPPQPLTNQPMSNNMVPPIFPAANKLPLQVSSNQPILGVVSSTPSTMSQNLPQSFNYKPTTNQIPPQMFGSQPLSQPLNTVPKPNIIPTKSSTQNQFSSHMISGQPVLDASLSNKQTASQYPPQPLSNQSLTSVPSIHQVTTNQFPPQPLSSQSKPINFPFYQSSTTQYPSQPLINQPGQQVLPMSNNRQPLPSNQLYNPTNSAQLAHNQWTTHPTLNQQSQQSTVPLLNQTNHNVLSQPTSANLSSNSTVNQQTQRQMLPPNPLSANNYYNQGSENIKQSFPPTQNIQLATKECPQQNNINRSSQINYQQPHSGHGQQGFHNQQQDMYRPEQNASVVQQGFTKSWVNILLLL